MAAYAEIVEGRCRLRAQILSEDGKEQVRDEAVFECDDTETPKRLAHSLLERAPGSIRALFAAT